LHRAGLLTAIHVPDEATEAVRDLCRARHDLDDDLKRVCRRLLAFLLRQGRVYRSGSTWTVAHHAWLAKQFFEDPAPRATFGYYLSVVKVREAELAAIDREVRGWVDREPFADAAHRLAAYHAVGYLGGLSIAVEVGEWRRFASAPAFMAFTGLVPSEYSSGGRRWQGSVTKTGNVVVRTQLIESAWHYRHNAAPGRPLKERQSHVGPDTVARATVAHRRLSTRYRRLAARGKNPKLVTTAVARELAGFRWAEMTS